MYFDVIVSWLMSGFGDKVQDFAVCFNIALTQLARAGTLNPVVAGSSPGSRFCSSFLA